MPQKTLSILPGCYDHEHKDWLIGPVGQHRDSESVETSNYRVAMARLATIDPEGVDHEDHRFGHWAVGWVEEIATRPGSACAVEAEKMRVELADYPYLDEDDHSTLESEMMSENWPDIISDTKREILECVHEDNRDDVDDLPDATIETVISEYLQRGSVEEREGWPHFDARDYLAMAQTLVDGLPE